MLSGPGQWVRSQVTSHDAFINHPILMMRLIYIIHIHTLVLDHSKCMYSFSKRRQGRMSSKLKKWYHENAVLNAVFPQGQKGSASFQISKLDTT